MKTAVWILRMCVTTPIWWYLIYKLMTMVEATELMWFLFWVFIPLTIVLVIVEKIIEKDAL